MKDWLKCQISPLVKYRQNQKHIEQSSLSLILYLVHTINNFVLNDMQSSLSLAIELIQFKDTLKLCPYLGVFNGNWLEMHILWETLEIKTCNEVQTCNIVISVALVSNKWNLMLMQELVQVYGC